LGGARSAGGEPSPPDNLELWWSVVTAARRSSEPGAGAVLALAAARYAGLALARAARDPGFRLPRARLAESCEAAPEDDLPDRLEARIPLLRGKLLSASKFKRAAALSGLESLARSGLDGPIGRQALFAVLRHADSLPTRLDPIELDRIRACLKHIPYAPIRDAAQRALEGDRSIRPTSSSAVDCDAARAQLEDATPHLTPHAAPPLALPVLALHLLRANRHTDVAARFLDAQLARTTSLPPGHLVEIGRLLQSRGHYAEAEAYFEEALRFRERDAKLARGDALRRRAYLAIEGGDRALAQSLLGEARTLMTT
jgi:tetratricopeptide (TPR) repeat protein